MRLTKEEAHAFWKDATGKNAPEQYLFGDGTELRSHYLCNKINALKLDKKATTILEIGCNAGRNLIALGVEGYRKVFGVEISQKAVDFFTETTADMVWKPQIFCKAAEEFVADLMPYSVDLIYTMATLLHIHPDSEQLFQSIKNACKTHLMLIEYEGSDALTSSSRIWERNYAEIFSEEFDLVESEPVRGQCDSALEHYIYRLFKRRT